MRFNPHEPQRYCIERVINQRYIGLFLEMGLFGKTVITLTAINYLRYYVFDVRKVLIVAPKKVAEATWQNEAKKWDHLKLLRINTVMGTKTQRIKALNTIGDIWVISRDNVAWLVDYYRNAWPFDMVVLDESTSFKNPQAKRFKWLSYMRPHIQRLVLLTGTPAPNGLMDLWAQIFLLDGGQRLHKTISQYRVRYFDHDIYTRRYKLKEGSEAAIHNAISDICVSLTAADYPYELPRVVHVDVPVKLDAKVSELYKKFEREMLLEVDEMMLNVGSAAVLTNKLLQFCNGAVYDDDHNAIEIHNCKIEAFMELIESLEGKSVLVFYCFQSDLERMERVLKRTELRVRRLKGKQDAEDWNTGKIDVLLAHPASCAYGLNLQQGGNHIIWYGLTWNLELWQQANARLPRPGQKEAVIIHILYVPDTRDEDVIQALAQKGEVQNRLMQSLKARIKRIKEER